MTEQLPANPPTVSDCCANRSATTTDVISSNPLGILSRLTQQCYCSQIPGHECDPCAAAAEIERLRADLEEAQRDLRLCRGHDIVAKFRMLAAERDDLLDKLIAARAALEHRTEGQ